MNFKGDCAFNIKSKGQVLLVGNTADPATPLEMSVIHFCTTHFVIKVGQN